MKSNRSMDRITRGAFSLVELMTVVAIVGLIAGTAVPSVVRRVPAYRLNGAVRGIDAILREARMQAMVEGREVTCTFNIDQRTATLTTPTNPEGRIRELGISPSVDWSTTPSLAFIFRPDGTLRTDSPDEVFSIHLNGQGDAGERWLIVWPSGVGQIISTSRFNS